MLEVERQVSSTISYDQSQLDPDPGHFDEPAPAPKYKPFKHKHHQPKKALYPIELDTRTQQIQLYIYSETFFFLLHFVKYYSPLCYCILSLQLHTLCCCCCCCCCCSSSSSMAVGVCFLLVCIITVFSSLRLGSCSLCPKDSNLFLYALHSQCPISISPNPPLQVRFLFFFLFNFTFP